MTVERPWENGKCEECLYCIWDDMCRAGRLGTSYLYCPAVVKCPNFKKKKQTKKVENNVEYEEMP